MPTRCSSPEPRPQVGTPDAPKKAPEQRTPANKASADKPPAHGGKKAISRQLTPATWVNTTPQNCGQGDTPFPLAPNNKQTCLFPELDDKQHCEAGAVLRGALNAYAEAEKPRPL